MKDKLTILCALLVVSLFVSNGAWFYQNQQLQDNEQELQAKLDLLSSENSILRTQNADLLNQTINLTSQNLLLKSQLAAMQEALNESRDNYSELNQQYVALNADFNILQMQYNILFNQNVALENNFTLLTLQYIQLQSNYSELLTQQEITQNQYDGLLSQYNSLSGLYAALLEDYNLLTQNYDNLMISYVAALDNLMYLDLVHIDSLVHDYYETIRDKKSPLLPTYNEMAEFLANLAKHDEGTIWWSDIGMEYYDITGSYRLYEARATLLNIIALSGVDNDDTNPEKIDKILFYVNSKVDYQHDLNDKGFFPTETLNSGTGDCEDYSILFSALFELVGVQSAVGLFESDDGTSGHSMVLVQLPDLGGEGYYSYGDLTGYGLSSGKWIIIESQRDGIENQDTSSWFTKWIIKAAAET